MWNLKNNTNELIYKTETDSQRTKLWFLAGRMLERIVLEFGIDLYTLLYLNGINNKNLLYCTGDSGQCCWQSRWEGSLGENQFSSVVSQLFVNPWTAACQASLSITNSQSLLKLMSIELVMSSNHLILCHPLLLLPSIFPSIRVFYNESVLHIS